MVKDNWVADARTYQNSYTNPVVVGQVMSVNDADWSAFWSMGSSRTNPADASNLNLGKHIGEDTNTTRADESIGYIVIESGSGTINGVAYEAAPGGDTVRGFDDSSSPYSYTLSGGLASVSAAATSISGMDGNNGGKDAGVRRLFWPIFIHSSLKLHTLPPMKISYQQLSALVEALDTGAEIRWYWDKKIDAVLLYADYDICGFSLE
jgi:hypothetical protein